MASQLSHNILLNPEFENNLLKQLPQILPPLLPATLASLLHSQSHSDQPKKTSLKNPDELKALPLSLPASETGCVIYASPVVQGTAHGDASVISASCDLLPYQGVCELQLSIKDKGTEALPLFSSAQSLASSNWSRDLLPPAEGLICLQDLEFKQAEINAGATPDGPLIQPMFVGEAAVQIHLTQRPEALKQTFQSANKPACLPLSLEITATSVYLPGQPRLQDVPGNWDPGPEKITGNLQDLFDVMGWYTKESLQACCVSSEKSEREEVNQLLKVFPHLSTNFHLQAEIFKCYLADPWLNAVLYTPEKDRMLVPDAVNCQEQIINCLFFFSAG